MSEFEGLKEYPWECSYRTSALNSSGKAVDILHDFYIPALSRITQYDRVAGYFRSSSLAAASQGYTAFLNHGGSMRLIVGADLQLEDVAAILKGNQQRLSDKLMEQLEHEDTWPENVKNGIALLSEMVAQKRLEVRVAFRVNAKTGEPIAVDSPEDGYVHEKWFVMQDAEGNRLSGSGSLNESRTALAVNAENIDVNCEWEGGNDKKRVERAVTDFEILWGGHNPYMKVYKIPEAVEKKLVRLKTLRNKPTEVDGTVISISPVKKHTVGFSSQDILRFSILKDAPMMPKGIYIGMYSAPVEPWPHQEMVARRLVESYPYSYMLCDEVGLGKTIEAALAIRSLMLSGRAKRVLIMPPAGLAEQWHRELASKAMLPFCRSVSKPGVKGTALCKWLIPNELEETKPSIFSADSNIVSHGLVSRKERFEQLASAGKFDIVLVDEAHYARRQNPTKHSIGTPVYGKLYKVLDATIRAKTKCMWMATATPMQLDSIEAYDLLRLTKRIGEFAYDPSLCLSYFDLMGKMLVIGELNLQEWQMLGQSFSNLEALDNYLWKRIQVSVVSSKNDRVLKKLREREPKSVDVKYLKRPLFAASPLSRVMMRHTRSLLEIYRENGKLNSNLAKRNVLPLCVIKFTPAEAAFYELLKKYCDELKNQILKHNSQSKQVLTFLLNFLQLRFASSFDAIKLTLQRRLEKVKHTLLLDKYDIGSEDELQERLEELAGSIDDGIDEEDLNEITFAGILKQRSKIDLEWEKRNLERLLSKLDNITETPSKIQMLLQEIGKRKNGSRVRQMVIFTRFRDTLDSIRRNLKIREPSLRVGVYAGGFASMYDTSKGADVSVSHEEIKKRFVTGDVDILLCTDAAAEGLNLQTADFIVNFDMGWNPMKIEQRIGRIDRIGQKHNEIHVLNMCYIGSTEEKVYGRLLNRLAQANLVVGAQQISMLPVSALDFRELEEGSLSEEELEEKSKEILKQQQERIKSMEMSAGDLYEIYSKLSKDAKAEKLPASVDDIWDAVTNSEYLKELGMIIDQDAIIHFKDDAEPDKEILVSKDREKIDDKVNFLSWGNPVLATIFERVTEKAEDLPWLKRIEFSKEGLSIIGYVVATTTGPILVTAYEQIKGKEIDESYVISDDEIDEFKQQLGTKDTDEIKRVRQIRLTEKINEEFALAHFTLLKHAAIGVLKQLEEEDLKTAIDIENYLEENTKNIFRVDMPKEYLDTKRNTALFDIYQSSGNLMVNVSGLLLHLVFEYIERMVDGIAKDKKKSDITIGEIISRVVRDRAN